MKQYNYHFEYKGEVITSGIIEGKSIGEVKANLARLKRNQLEIIRKPLNKVKLIISKIVV